MYGTGNMHLVYTSEKEHQYWSRFNIRYYKGDWFRTTLLSRVINPTILVSKEYQVLSIGKSMHV